MSVGVGKKGFVDPRYFSDGQRWEDEVVATVKRSRNMWRFLGLSSVLGIGAALACVATLLPLQRTEVVTLLVDRATGFTEIAHPMEEGGPISQREAVTQANIVRYLRARETYDPRGLKDNYDLASLLSGGVAAKDLQAEFDLGNPDNPMKKLGPLTTISIYVASVNFLTDAWRSDPAALGTAAVRFETLRKNEREAAKEYWVANVRFHYTSQPMKNDWRFDNPLGFQVVEYRRDQESVGPTVEIKP